MGSARGSGLAITHPSNEDKSCDRKEADFIREKDVANRFFFCHARGALSFPKS